MMIIKNLTRRTGIKQLVYYVLEKERVIVHKTIPYLNIYHNVRTRNVDLIIKEFEQNEKLRVHHRKDNVLLNHAVISFSKEDTPHLNEKTIKDLIDKFIELRGERNMYIGSLHRDKDHLHVHLLYPGIELGTGLSNRISRDQFNKIKIELDLYQRLKYPELYHSLPKLNSQPDCLHKSIDKRQSIKGELQRSIKLALSTSKSKEEFIQHLSNVGYNPYYRSGQLQGVQFGAMKFRFKTLGINNAFFESFSVRRSEFLSIESIRTSRKNSQRLKIDRNRKQISL